MNKEEVIEKLRSALKFVEEYAKPEVGYGFFPGGDPRDFTPDSKASTPEEHNRWVEDCALAKIHGVMQEPAGTWVAGSHILRQFYGLGSYIYRNIEAEDCLRLLIEVIKELKGEGNE